ncbi:hypothetical protein [Pseudovibrio sp. Ad26]|uniref:hypothetical protein n=1 Tax=Pseudovibrio sp. Ad26 TaxID=989410 RepID=UPI0007AE5B71|nr:hypothetical protein [Pseudovibrio sp. Ad26]KZK99175.1 hypothetical protein PsAD26_04984 [Pseudovibrio sp. Ad26]
MTDRPILFSSPMIQALLEGRKTHTRRILKPQPTACGGKFPGAIYESDYSWPTGKHGCFTVSCKPHPPESYLKAYPLKPAPGDLLWVRETWARIEEVECGCSEICGCPQVGEVRYRATVGDDERRWKPSIFMPRKYSRITLEVTNVRVELLQKISAKDAVSEGVQLKHWITGNYPEHDIGVEREGEVLRNKFRNLWNTLNESRGFGWNANPWVTVTEFKVHRCNINELTSKAVA